MVHPNITPRRRDCGCGSAGCATYQILAIGDSCLFHLCDASLLKSLPLSHVADFSNSPYLLASQHRYNLDLEGHIYTSSSSAHAGDTLLLLTDALAQWFIHEIEQGNDPAAEVEEVLVESDPRSFLAWVETRRATGLRNDDVTLLVIDL